MLLKTTNNEFKVAFEAVAQMPCFTNFNGTVTAEKGGECGFSTSETMQGLHIKAATVNGFLHALTLLTSGGKTFTKSSRGRLGVMLDCARNAVPTITFLKRYIKHLALMGYDFIGLYLEDLLQLDDEPYFGYKRGRFTKEELKEVSIYAASFGIELMPYVQTLAHLNHALKWSEYGDIIDCQDILLVGEEKTYKLIDKILKFCSEAFISRRVNIGMDEAHMLGLGRYLDLHGMKNRFEIMTGHINRVQEICKKYNLQPEMWSDMYFRLANNGEYYTENTIDAKYSKYVPDGIKLVYWDYYNKEQKNYEIMIENHKLLSDNVGFAGGAWTWVGVTPKNRLSMRNLGAAIPACKKLDIDEICLTMWGDFGGEGSFFGVSAALMNNAFTMLDEMPTNDQKDAFSMSLFGYTFNEMLTLDQPAFKDDVSDNAGVYLLYQDLLLNLFDRALEDNATEFANAAVKALTPLAERESEFVYLFKTQLALSRVLQIKALLGRRITRAYKLKDKNTLIEIAEKEIPELIIRLKDFHNKLSKQWQLEKKSFGLDSVNFRHGGMAAQFEYVASVLKNHIETGEKIAELEEENLKYYSVWDEDSSKNSTFINAWQAIFTNARVAF